MIGLGYSGRGVALGVSFGAQLAAAASGADPDELSVPTTAVPQIPFHGFWSIGVAMGVAYARWRDWVAPRAAS